jgi:hypothetical protein
MKSKAPLSSMVSVAPAACLGCAATAIAGSALESGRANDNAWGRLLPANLRANNPAAKE